MKFSCFAIIAFCTVFSATAQDKSALKTEQDKVSYAIGLDIGKSFKQQGVEVNPEIVLRALLDGMTGAKPQMTDEEIKVTMSAYMKSIMEKQAAMQKEAGQKNIATGEKFLAENKTKEGVKATASGLQYKVLKEGTGPSPKASDTVETHYRGTLIDGKEFDSSIERGQPATFPVSGVIKGWTEALQLMKVGSKYQLFVPANLAYGERGAGQDIGPNETLIFEVELLGIKSPATPAPTPKPSPSPK